MSPTTCKALKSARQPGDLPPPGEVKCRPEEQQRGRPPLEEQRLLPGEQRLLPGEQRLLPGDQF